MTDCLSQPRKVVPTVAEGVILDHELRGHWRTEAEGERRGAIQFFVGKGADRIGCFSAVFQ